MEFKRGLRDGIPICLGYFSVSVAFGVMAIQYGLTWVEAVMISLLNLTSAGQYAGLTIIASPTGGLFEMALSQLLINARYALMGISLSQKVEKKFTTSYRLVLGFAITDEIFAVASGNKTVSRAYMAGLAILPILGWSGGTLCGALIGSIMPQILQNALGVALFGMFIAVVVPDAKANKRILAVAGIAITCSTLMYYLPVLKEVSSGFSVIICTVIAATLGALLFPKKEVEADAD